MTAQRHLWSNAVQALSRFSLIVPLVLVVLVGCGSDDPRISVSGTITINGTPIENGAIAFHPRRGTPSPTAGATIKNGKYEIAQGKGINPGEFEVRIHAIRKTDRVAHDIVTDEPFAVNEQFLPARFNTKTELSVVIEESGSPVDFDLEL